MEFAHYKCFIIIISSSSSSSSSTHDTFVCSVLPLACKVEGRGALMMLKQLSMMESQV